MNSNSDLRSYFYRDSYFGLATVHNDGSVILEEMGRELELSDASNDTRMQLYDFTSDGNNRQNLSSDSHIQVYV